MGNSRISYILLNVFRVLNILSITGVILSAGALLVKTANLTESIGWFNVPDLAEKVLIILFASCLLLTEIPKVLRGYFARQWPSFSHQSGFVALAVCLMFLGCDALSYLTKEQTDEEHLGADFYRMVQAAGLMCIIMAVINIIASIFLRDRRRGLTARQVRAYKTDFSEAV